MSSIEDQLKYIQCKLGICTICGIADAPNCPVCAASKVAKKLREKKIAADVAHQEYLYTLQENQTRAWAIAKDKLVDDFWLPEV